MMPTIRVEDDVFEGLKKLAEPFTDTPNSVIRRLLKERGVLRQAASDQGHQEAVSVEAEPKNSSSRAESKHVLTPQPVYEQFLLHVLATEFKGRADKHHVTKAVIQLMKSQGFIGPADLETVSTGETKAENTIAWGRNSLKERGLISRYSRRGTWELTQEGLHKAKELVLPVNTQ